MKKTELSISHHPQHIILGIVQIAVSIVLLLHKFYFFWPPFLVAFLNDDIIGGCGIIFGVWLIKWALSDKSSLSVNRNLLLFSSFFWGFEATAEICHAVVARQAHMLTAGILEIGLFLFTLSIIGKSKKHQY